jgi:aspartate kinase
LRERHCATAKELVDAADYVWLGAEIAREFDLLDEFLKGVAAVGELSPRSSDYVVSFGERLNSRIVSAAYQARGIRSCVLDARKVMVTDAQHGRAVPQIEEIEHRAKNLVRPLLDDTQVPVMGGFIGATAEGVQTTIGLAAPTSPLR